MRNDREVGHFNAIDVGRAIENQVVWDSTNQFGSHGRLRFPGHSRVVESATVTPVQSGGSVSATVTLAV